MAGVELGAPSPHAHARSHLALCGVGGGGIQALCRSCAGREVARSSSGLPVSRAAEIVSCPASQFQVSDANPQSQSRSQFPPTPRLPHLPGLPPLVPKPRSPDKDESCHTPLDESCHAHLSPDRRTHDQPDRHGAAPSDPIPNVLYSGVPIATAQTKTYHVVCSSLPHGRSTTALNHGAQPRTHLVARPLTDPTSDASYYSCPRCPVSLWCRAGVARSRSEGQETRSASRGGVQRGGRGGMGRRVPR